MRRFAAALLPRMFGNNVPGHTTRAPPVGFELATSGIQFYVVAGTANVTRISLPAIAKVAVFVLAVALFCHETCTNISSTILMSESSQSPCESRKRNYQARHVQATDIPSQLPGALVRFLADNDIDDGVYAAANSISRYIRISPRRPIDLCMLAEQVRTEIVGHIGNKRFSVSALPFA